MNRLARWVGVAVTALALASCSFGSDVPDVPEQPVRHDEIEAGLRAEVEKFDEVTVDKLYYQWTDGAFGPSGDESFMTVMLDTAAQTPAESTALADEIEAALAPIVVTAVEDGSLKLVVGPEVDQNDSRSITYDELAAKYDLERG